MKRRRPEARSLFSDDRRVEYLMDTSSWLAIDDLPDRDALWATVERLIQGDRLFAPTKVVDEIISLGSRIKPYKDKLVRCSRNDIPYLLKVGQITWKYRRLSKPAGTRTKADPFLIALAILDDYTIVAEESLKSPSSKIPGVCLKENATCITLRDLLRIERLG